MLAPTRVPRNFVHAHPRTHTQMTAFGLASRLHPAQTVGLAPQRPDGADQDLVTQPRPQLARPALRLLARVVLCASLLWALPAWADDEAEFLRKPTPALAERVAKAALAKNQYAKAMNWAERIVQLPGVTGEQQNWVARLRNDLKWRLPDAGVAPVVLHITPAKADVLIDGVHVPHHASTHTLWLPEGAHALEVIAADYATATLTIASRVGERSQYDVELDATKVPELIFHVTPEADIFLNGARLGTTGKIRYVQPSGGYKVELRAAGYETWAQEFELRPGQVKHVDVQLKSTKPPVDPAKERRAHQIDRPLLPSELAEGAERHKFTVETGSQLDRALGARAAADAASPEHQRKARESVAKSAEQPRVVDAEKFEQSDAMARDDRASEKAAPLPDTLREVEKYVADATKRHAEPLDLAPNKAKAGDDPKPTPEKDTAKRAPVDDEPDAYAHVEAPPGPGLSRTAKGWIFGGTGAAILGAGLAWAYLGTLDAEAANQEKRGSKTYADDYAAAAQQTYVGYGVAGVGAVGVGVGAYYLFSEGGLSRRGKGWVVTTVGALTAVAGGWIAWSAVQAANDTVDTLKPTNPEYTRRFDLAERDRWIGIGVAGAGAAIVATGIALVATSNSSSAHADEPAERPSLAKRLKWQVAPWLANSGAARTTGAMARLEF